MLSRSTFAMIEAAETMGNFASALCSEIISTSNGTFSAVWRPNRSANTSEASTYALSGRSVRITSAMV